MKPITIETKSGTTVHVDNQHVSINGMEFDLNDLHFVYVNLFSEEAMVRVEFNGRIVR